MFTNQKVVNFFDRSYLIKPPLLKTNLKTFSMQTRSERYTG